MFAMKTFDTYISAFLNRANSVNYFLNKYGLRAKINRRSDQFTAIIVDSSNRLQCKRNS